MDVFKEFNPNFKCHFETLAYDIPFTTNDILLIMSESFYAHSKNYLHNDRLNILIS